MTLSAAERLDAINIGLMLLSCAVAVIIPLELFLFSYAILGPLHYLTEISWLHDRKYFLPRRSIAGSVHAPARNAAARPLPARVGPRARPYYGVVDAASICSLSHSRMTAVVRRPRSTVGRNG